MFNCSTEFTCDMCGTSLHSHGKRMSECMNKAWFRKLYRERGWRTVYSKYDICPDCVKHYGMKYIRKKIKEEANNG